METYSTYDAKAKLSEILRKVRRGATVQISHRGEVVAEIRPKRRSIGLQERLDDLSLRGAVGREPASTPRLVPLVSKPGALERFLDSREE